MKKFDFYLYLNLFNILLVMFMFGIFLVFFIICYISQNWILPICFILLYLLAKLFILYLLFVTLVKVSPNSELIRVAGELKTSPTLRMHSLLLAFGYDAIIMLCFALHDIIEYRFEWLSLLAYEILTLGGVCMFYVALFAIWKIQGKLKP